MFTGIIEALGTVERIEKGGDFNRLFIKVPASFQDIKVGDSISVNGVCLTVVGLKRQVAFFDVTRHTLNMTNLGGLRPQGKVNLERAIKAGDRLSGHFVTGHVDGIGKIKGKIIGPKQAFMEIELPPQLIEGLVPEGSVAVDGISLTVAKIQRSSFGVYLIPHTLKNTTLGFKGAKDMLNIELDILGKYARQPRSPAGHKQEGQKLTEEFLREKGFI